MDAKTFKQKILPMETAMHRMARHMTGNEQDARDTVQDAMVALWQGRGDLGKVVNLEAYCIEITKRKSIDLMRKRHPNVALDQAPPLATDDPPDDPIELVLSKLDNLPDMQRRAIRMKYLEGRDNREIEQRLHLSPDNLRAHLSRGYKKLRELINDD